jgi:hypothetical protein
MLATLVFILPGCKKDFLEQKPTSTVLTYYKNVEELENGLVACYAALRYTGFDNVEWLFGDIGSDDADKGSFAGDQPELQSISLSRQDASNGWVSQPWFGYYSIINKCNLVIDNSPLTKGDTTKIRDIINQAKFLRALSFYHLLSLYGDVPLVTSYLNPDELKLKRDPVSEVWSQIESDLISATNLPLTAESGRITSGAAYSLLGKVYLTEQKYDAANFAFHKVISSGHYQLVPDYGSIFRHEGENNIESIFEIQHKSDIVSGGSMGTSSVVWRLPRDNGQPGWGFDAPTNNLLNEFEDGDPRIIYTFIFRGDVFPSGAGTYTVENTDSPSGLQARKAWIPESERENLGWWEWDYNWRYMRYAEVLLLYSESLNEVNKPDSARLFLNMVRERARNTPTIDPQRVSCARDLSHSGPLLPDVTTSNKSDLRNVIWHEQRVEFAIEGHRRNMLLRIRQFKECMEAAKGDEGCKVEPYELLLPIPKREIELSNNVLIQNPGY